MPSSFYTSADKFLVVMLRYLNKINKNKKSSLLKLINIFLFKKKVDVQVVVVQVQTWRLFLFLFCKQRRWWHLTVSNSKNLRQYRRLSGDYISAPAAFLKKQATLVQLPHQQLCVIQFSSPWMNGKCGSIKIKVLPFSDAAPSSVESRQLFSFSTANISTPV